MSDFVNGLYGALIQRRTFVEFGSRLRASYVVSSGTSLAGAL